MQKPRTHTDHLDRLGAQDWVRYCAWYEEIDSTSDEARRYCAGTTAVLPALFVADFQTAGRGRSSNRWWSPHGCLMMTLALSEDELPSAVSERMVLSLVSGVAIAEAIESVATGISVQLKWPNDLYVQERKLGGILIESILPSPQSGRAAWLIGIGINVDINWPSAPAELQSKATCITSAGAHRCSREFLLPHILLRLRTWFAGWRSGVDDWYSQWTSRSMLTDRVIRVRVPGEPALTGRCFGIDRLGRLLCQSERGQHALSNGEILDWSSQ